MNKTLYTVITGGYDDLKRILVRTPGWRYVCITDEPTVSSEWEIMQCSSEEGERMAAKRLKIIQPFEGLSIYIDGSFAVNYNLDDFVRRHHVEGKISLMRHHIRKCVYAEVDECMRLGKADKEELITAKDVLIRNGVPRNKHLGESGIIIRDRVTDLQLRWMELLPMCQRDQVSFPMAANEYPDQYHLFDYDYSKGRDFPYVPHLEDKRRDAYLRMHAVNKIIPI